MGDQEFRALIREARSQGRVEEAIRELLPHLELDYEHWSLLATELGRHAIRSLRGKEVTIRDVLRQFSSSGGTEGELYGHVLEGPRTRSRLATIATPVGFLQALERLALSKKRERLKLREPHPLCELCEGTGVLDTGAMNPDGTWIEAPCDCIEGNPHLPEDYPRVEPQPGSPVIQWTRAPETPVGNGVGNGVEQWTYEGETGGGEQPQDPVVNEGVIVQPDPPE